MSHYQVGYVAGVNMWMHDPNPYMPALFDLRMGAVDPQHPWVSVTRITQAWNIHKEWMNHPSTRMGATASSCTLPEITDLPVWVQERIAVLNIAPDDTHVPGIGRRWARSQHTPGGFNSSYPGTYYTLDWHLTYAEGTTS